jgi:hypothetical protein
MRQRRLRYRPSPSGYGNSSARSITRGSSLLHQSAAAPAQPDHSVHVSSNGPDAAGCRARGCDPSWNGCGYGYGWSPFAYPASVVVLRGAGLSSPGGFRGMHGMAMQPGRPPGRPRADARALAKKRLAQTQASRLDDSPCDVMIRRVGINRDDQSRSQRPSWKYQRSPRCSQFWATQCSPWRSRIQRPPRVAFERTMQTPR